VVAAVDAKAQIIAAAQTLGSCSEQGALIPTLETRAHLRTGQTLITADAGYHSEENFRALCERGVPALIVDGLMRRRQCSTESSSRQRMVLFSRQKRL
jgi:hypothetical protein